MKLLKYLSWVVLIPVDLISMVLAVILAPFVVPFYSDKTGHLPVGFQWMETYDNPIDGDKGHIERWAKIRKTPVVGVYAQRVAWLWRNKAYNFAYYKLGRDATSKFNYTGNPEVKSGSSLPEHHGWLVMWNEDAWGVFAHQNHLRIGKVQFYLRVYCGWKLKSELSRDIDRAMLAFHVNPFRFYVVK